MLHAILDRWLMSFYNRTLLGCAHAGCVKDLCHQHMAPLKKLCTDHQKWVIFDQDHRADVKGAGRVMKQNISQII